VRIVETLTLIIIIIDIIAYLLFFFFFSFSFSLDPVLERAPESASRREFDLELDCGIVLDLESELDFDLGEVIDFETELGDFEAGFDRERDLELETVPAFDFSLESAEPEPELADPDLRPGPVPEL
jgi:hypothetical protein